MLYRIPYSKKRSCLSVLLLLCSFFFYACGGSDSNSDSSDSTDSSTGSDDSATELEAVDITNAIFSERSPDCGDYVNTYEASVLDIQESTGFEAGVTISSDDETCTFMSDAIPNHDFNDDTADFGGPAAEQELEFTVVRNPSMALSSTPLSQRIKNGIMLNGVVLDILSAGCYDPTNPDADEDGNVGIGCGEDSAWLLDPLGTAKKFGADLNNAHVQPGGLYHYHGSPKAMFDDNPGPEGSPVIGFAADGFPIYGSYFWDEASGTVRKAVSGYTLKEGERISIDGLNPGGTYDGNYVADWEFTDSGDLDECNGMTVNGQYGYYAIDTYPWVIACHSGTPHESFILNGGGPPP
ncbi:YHYH protein [Agarilytica rhodophyticola]|uniref:YHYH protein n=1 Tax=Agarilytica rhodophyticola TaxID=1737490 RepID=UPI000B347D88|nr:YHYH protein [Agarilytica rhodophyticola]